MSLTTRCPECNTAFRVHADQLSARGGRVRCGKCARVFDGVAQLVQDSPAVAVAPEPSPQLPLFEGARQSGARAGQTAITGAAGTPSAGTASPVRGLEHPWVDAVPGPRYRVLWSLFALLAGLALIAQATYRFRTEIGLLLPQSRAFLEAACEFADCSVGLPRHADLLSIESSDLQMDPQRGTLIVLNALLRNRAQFPQEYPALELTLTDEGDRAVVRKVLRPADYLDARLSSEAATQGIGGGSETLVRVHFDASRVRATGYRLYLFYP